jgi:hypothetical protein
MKLITKAVEESLLKAPLYSTDGNTFAPVILKLFNPYGAGTWYALEAEKEEDGDWRFFGLADILEPELGYFTLSQLMSVKKFGKPSIERDMYFSGYIVDKTTNTVKKAA